MTNLPAKLRAQLSEEYPLYVPSVLEEAVSNDGTHKLLLEYHDGVCVETVAIATATVLRSASPRKLAALWRARFARQGKKALRAI